MITIANVKAHLRITNDNEDALLDDYVESAYSFVESFIDRKIFDTQELLDAAVTDETLAEAGAGIVHNPRIKLAVMQIVGYIHENREANSDYFLEICRATIDSDRRFGF